MLNLFDNIFFKRKVLVTGHTGFKGSWICLLLNQLGADVYGFALKPPTNPNLFTVADVGQSVKSFIGDIRNFDQLKDVVEIVQPELVIHLAAQPLVRRSYLEPVATYATNVMGTVHLLEVVRNTPSIRAVVNVTTDKCYQNNEWYWGYRENEPMGGHDPYSNSKGCSELVTSAYRSSFFSNIGLAAIATARAGNVIGGGDWAEDRLIPDFFRALSKNEKLLIRSPYAIRPWQHVLEPLNGYLTLAKKLLEEGTTYAEAWNFGPDDADAKNVEWIARRICNLWGDCADFGIDINPNQHEATYLKLDCSKAKSRLNWVPKWSIEKALLSIVEWNRAWMGQKDMREICNKQIEDFFTE